MYSSRLSLWLIGNIHGANPAHVRSLAASRNSCSAKDSGNANLEADDTLGYAKLDPTLIAGSFKGLPGPLFRPRDQYDKRIYILGVGNLGAFVAHSLAGLPARPSITLLLKRPQVRLWEERGCSIDVTARGMTETRKGFDVEILPDVFSQLETKQDRSGQSETETLSQISHIQDLSAEGLSPRPSLQFPSRDLSAYGAETRPQDGSKAVNNPAEPQQKKHVAPTERPTADAAPHADTEHEHVIRTRFAQQDKDGQPPELESTRISRESESLSDTMAEGEDLRHLIVTVKAPQTVRALQAVAHRITKDSTILFLQNGMGIIDEVNEKLFPDENSRPTYIIGVVSHGLYSQRRFSVVHAGEGTIALGIMPRMPMSENRSLQQLNHVSTSARYIMRTITRTSLFVAVGFPPTDLLQQQLDKLAVNCIINPLTAIFDIKNGDLLHNFHFTRVIRLLLAEISIVIRNLQELKNVPNVNMRYDSIRLERLVFSIANSTAANKSSMLQDLQANKPTEIDYINGYVVKRGEQMGLHCVMNYMLVHMIKGKRKVSQQEDDPLPFKGFGKVK